MESLSSTTSRLNSLESDLQSLTIQNNLQDIINLIEKNQIDSSFKNKKSYKKSSTKRKGPESDFDQLIQSAIQKQLKNYIEKIESNLKKYWYTDMESKLYAFLTDLKINWEFFEPYFNVDESIDYLEETIHMYILDLKKQRSQIEIDELLEIISDSFEYWPIQKAHRCTELAEFVDRKKEIEEELITIQTQLIVSNIENATESIVLSNLGKKFPLLNDIKTDHVLLETLNNKIEKLKQEESFLSVVHSLDILEETILRGGMWDQTIEEDALKEYFKLNVTQKNEFFKRFVSLLKFYYEEFKKSNSILDMYPELSNQQQTVHINFTYEGAWLLNVYFKGRWFPGYRLKDQVDLSNVEFIQEGEWKNRKFKCFSWTLKGRIPIGTIIKLTNKKEILYQIVTKTATNHLRDINLTTIDEKLIKNLFTGSIELRAKPKENHETFSLSNNHQLKFALKIISIDKNRVTKLVNILESSVKEKGPKLNSLLDKTKDAKFIHFLDKIQST